MPRGMSFNDYLAAVRQYGGSVSDGNYEAGRPQYSQEEWDALSPQERNQALNGIGERGLQYYGNEYALDDSDADIFNQWIKPKSRPGGFADGGRVTGRDRFIEEEIRKGMDGGAPAGLYSLLD